MRDGGLGKDGEVLGRGIVAGDGIGAADGEGGTKFLRKMAEPFLFGVELRRLSWFRERISKRNI